MSGRRHQKLLDTVRVLDDARAMENSWRHSLLLALLLSACNATPDAEIRPNDDAGADDVAAVGLAT